MKLQIEEYYSKIGELAAAQAMGNVGYILIYAEVENGSISCDLFYVDDHDIVHCRFCDYQIRDLIYSFWLDWKSITRNAEWRCLEYVIRGSEFTIDLTYPNKIDDSRGVASRDQAIVRKHFGDLEIDYSKPRG